MNRAEVGTLIERVRAFCPAQNFTEATSEVWAEELAPFVAEYVRTAAETLLRAPREPVGRNRYLHLGDLIAESRRQARQVTNRVSLPGPPPAADTAVSRDQWSKDLVAARNTGDIDGFLRKWYGTANLRALTGGRP